ncbi:hypothetical protein SMC26_39170 [Actinomadura fulvescens]|uniref:Uncharacterized protein n=1 Tax=Actinomadura fulvescens TaxID=46160 RepID=A0ABN3QVN7_9ACTN
MAAAVSATLVNAPSASASASASPSTARADAPAAAAAPVREKCKTVPEGFFCVGVRPGKNKKYGAVTAHYVKLKGRMRLVAYYMRRPGKKYAHMRTLAVKPGSQSEVGGIERLKRGCYQALLVLGKRNYSTGCLQYRGY